MTPVAAFIAWTSFLKMRPLSGPLLSLLLGVTLMAGGSAPVAAEPATGVTVPPGFSVDVFASGLGKVRLMAVHPTTGVLYASIIDRDAVVALPDKDKDGVPDRVVQVVSNIKQAHGLAFHAGWLYVAGTDRVVRFRDDDHDLKPDAAPEKIADLPGGGGHFSRTITCTPDGSTLLVSIGSTCNVCLEDNPERASIIAMTPEGKQRRLYATGLRNAVGITFDSRGRLWATNNGRDWLGNELPPECLYQVVDGGFYGWPYAYGNRVPDPEFGNIAPDKVAATIPPAWEFSAHTAPLGLGFYTGTAWPAEYQGDLFIAFHGSWNSSYKKGYEVMRLDFEKGVPKKAEVFLSGFLQSKDRVWGRPVDCITGADGQLYVSDDFGGRIFRVRRR